MKLFGLIGYPLEHSFSLPYFTEKFKREKISDSFFQNFPMREIDQIREMVRLNPDLKGLAVTIPHKQSVISHLDEMDPQALEIGAVNCISIKEGRLLGYNTDAIGFQNSFIKLLGPDHNKAIILGSGGSSLAVRFVLKKLGMEWITISRKEKGENRVGYNELGADLMASHRVIINCSPVGMHPDDFGYPAIPYEFITSAHYLYDLIYNPGETIFLQKGRERGAVCQNGLEMLKIQAEANWKIWNE